MEDRKVARPGEKAENPQVELLPEEIRKMIDGDGPTFIRRAKKLQGCRDRDAKIHFDAKDTKGLFDSLEGVDKACKSCHLGLSGIPMTRRHKGRQGSGDRRLTKGLDPFAVGTANALL